MKQFIVITFCFITGFVNAQFAGYIAPGIGFANNYAINEGRDIKKLTNRNTVVCGKQYRQATQNNRGKAIELNSYGGFISQQINTNTETFLTCDSIGANNFIAVGKRVNQGNHIIVLRRMYLLTLQWPLIYLPFSPIMVMCMIC